MANEITHSQQTRISKSINASNPLVAIAPAFEVYNDVYDWSGTKRFSSEATISTTYGALSFGGISTIGWVRLHNLDSTNYFEVGLEVAAAFQAVIRVGPGVRTGWFPVATMSLFGRANTGNVQAVVEAIEGAITKA